MELLLRTNDVGVAGIADHWRRVVPGAEASRIRLPGIRPFDSVTHSARARHSRRTCETSRPAAPLFAVRRSVYVVAAFPQSRGRQATPGLFTRRRALRV